MWLLCRRSVVIQDCAEDLEEQIVQFSSAVFDAIGTSYPILRNSGQERLWLIYFKGLLTANTHSLEKMVPALRNIASRGASEVCPRSRKDRERSRSLPLAAFQTPKL